MRKLVFFIDSMAKSGGIERVTANLANMWSSRGNSVDIVVFGEKGSFFLLDKNVNIVSLGIERYKTIWGTVLFYLKIVICFSIYVKKVKPNIVFGIWTSRAIIAVIAAAFSATRVVACEHIAYSKLRGELRLLRRFVYPFVDAIVSLTDHDTFLYKKINTKAYTIPNAIESAPLNLSHDKEKVILAVGRLVPQKGFDLLLKSWSYIFKKYPNWTIKIIGGELNGYKDFFDNLKHLVKKYEMENQVIFQKPTKNIIQEYDSSSLFVLSSRFEGLPMVLLEAMSRGLSVVSFDCPTGPAEIIQQNKNGILVANGNCEQLSLAIEKMIKDEKLRRAFGSKARTSIIENYSEAAIAHLWNNLVNDLMNKSRC